MCTVVDIYVFNMISILVLEGNAEFLFNLCLPDEYGRSHPRSQGHRAARNP